MSSTLAVPTKNLILTKKFVKIYIQDKERTVVKVLRKTAIAEELAMPPLILITIVLKYIVPNYFVDFFL